jgi:ABC-type sulfate/molybdate transport systems ATPase subunit
VADLLKRLHLTGVADALPKRVSRGERQLAALARAIAAGPAILLLDEPFQGIGDDTAKVAATMLQNMRKKGSTVIVATAEERTASFFPGARVARLHRGKLSEEATKAEPPAAPTRIRAEDVARAATADLVERSTAAEPEPAPSPAPAERAERPAGKKIRITSVGSL